LDSDSDRIVNWVQQHTQWIPYFGYLKGARGTFQARQGSHLDRTVLLATMLLKSGKKVKLVHAQTGTEAKSVILENLRGPTPWSDWSNKVLSLEERIQLRAAEFEAGTGEVEDALGMAGAFEHQMDQFRSGMLETVDSQSKRMEQVLQLGEAVGAHDYAPFAEQYFYVEYENEGEWKSVCPIFGNGIPVPLLDDLTAPVYYTSSTDFPNELVHKVKIRFLVDQYRDGKTTEKLALEREWVASTINFESLFVGVEGKSIDDLKAILTNTDTDLEGKEEEARKKVLDEEVWIPFIKVGSEDTMTENEFDRAGDVRKIETDVLGQKKALGSAISALGGLSLGGTSSAGSKPKQTLAGVRIEFITIDPYGDEVVETRNLFALAEGARTYFDEKGELNADSSAERAFACTRSYELFVQSAKSTLNLYKQKQLQLANAYRLPLKYMAMHLDGNDAEAMNALFKATEKVPQWDLQLVTLASARSSLTQASEHVFFARPNLLAKRSQIALQGEQSTLVRGFDILSNRMESLRQDPVHLFSMGVLDTILENTIARAGKLNREFDGTAFDYPTHLGDGKLHKVTAENLASMQHKVAPEAFPFLERDVHKFGTVVIADDGASPSLAWYRVNEVTGETLGMGVSPIGLAGSATEDVITRTMIIKALLTGAGAGVTGFFSCYQAGSGAIRTFSTCLVCSIIAAAVAVAGSLVIKGGVVPTPMKFAGAFTTACYIAATQMGG
jgi:hypothetical protein